MTHIRATANSSARRATAWAIAVASIVLLVAGCSGGGGGGSSGGSGGGAVTVAAPMIIAQPQSVRVGEGQTATFAVTAVSSAAVSYQWSRNGAAIAGATGATYSIAVTQLSDDGATFSVVVANAGGSVQSTAATLNVSPIAPSIANNVATSVSVIEGQPASFSVVASGSAPLVFQWRRGGAAIAGATSATYTIAATTLADNGAIFDVVVTNAAGTATSAPFTLTVTARVVAPSIATQPQSQSVRAGNPVTFTVTAAGTAPFTYQWLRNGVAIAGAQAATFTLTTTSASDNGAQFSVVVSNAAGSVTSNSATLTVVAQASLSLLAGNIGGPGTVDGAGTSARFSAPSGPALDNAGTLYVGDASIVRKITSAGVVTTFAGSPTVIGSADGTGSAASFGVVSGVAVDPSGIVFAVDRSNHTVRRITAAGVVTTFAGTNGAAGSADGTGTAASFNAPGGIASDAAGNLYVADSGNHTIRKITPGGIVTTLAGTAGAAGSADGTGAAARFNSPSALVVDSASNVFVADLANATIRKITAAGVVTTLAGTAGIVGSSDGTGAAARFSSPSGIAIDGASNLYVGDGANRTIRKVTAAGVVTTLVGRVGVSGSDDGTGSAATFSSFTGVVSDSAGTLSVADRGNYAIRNVTPSAVVTTRAGAATIQGANDGTGAAATFTLPFGITVDGAGTVYVSDAGDGTIRKITAGGVVTTLAGTPYLNGSADGTGAAARFGAVRAVKATASGMLYAADFSNNTIRAITPGGVVTTLAGSAPATGSADGTGSAARFNGPTGIAIDASGNLFVTDTINGTIRKVTPAGVVTTFVGTAGRAGASDGTGAAASFNLPSGIAIDAAGNLYVADTGNNTVRKVTSAGVVTTVAGTAGVPGSTDGTAARFRSPNGITVDPSGNVFVVDTGNRTIRKIDGSGVVSTVVGVANGRQGIQLGALPGSLDQPTQIASDGAGNLYLVDGNGVLMVTAP